MPDPTPVLVHYYRAMVGRADIWRMRMDATTNWAIGATAAVVSFALGNPSAPHAVVLIASFLTMIFLLLEARRLTFYHLWQQRVLLLERRFIAPALATAAADAGDDGSLERELRPQLGTTIPSMSIVKAAARRLRRVYVYLFVVQLAAWGLKLASHPAPTASVAEIVARAGVGPVPGAVLLGGAVLTLAGAVAMAGVAGGVRRGASSSDQGRRV